MRDTPTSPATAMRAVAIGSAFVAGLYYYTLLRGMSETIWFDPAWFAIGLGYTVLFLFGLGYLIAAFPLLVALRASTHVTNIVVWSVSGVLVVGSISVQMHAWASSDPLWLTVFCVGFLCAAVALPYLWMSSRRVAERAGGIAPALAGLLVALILGGIVGETYVLADEYAFQREITIAPERSYSRPRAWPATSCALLYQPGRGIFATD